MRKYWKVIGVLVLILGVLYYPILKLYLYLTKAKTEGSDRNNPDEGTPIKTFISGHRGNYKSHYPDPDDSNPNATLV